LIKSLERKYDVDDYLINFDTLPAIYQHRMRQYIRMKEHPGEFLSAVLSNDLIGTYVHAGDMDRDSVWDLIRWIGDNLDNDHHQDKFGSRVIVEKYLRSAD
jgi:hypothetical protein